jgi:hypothetical protein
MRMSTGHLCMHPHFDSEKGKQGAQTNNTRQCWVFHSEQVWETWIIQRLKCRRKKLRNARSEVFINGNIELTWTKAVAINTPVPKCLQKKKIVGGIFKLLNFLATTGNPAPKQENARTRTGSISMYRREVPIHVLLTEANNMQRQIVLLLGPSWLTPALWLSGYHDRCRWYCRGHVDRRYHCRHIRGTISSVRHT